LSVYTRLEVDLFSSNGKVGTKTVDTGKTVSKMTSSQMGTSVSQMSSTKMGTSVSVGESTIGSYGSGNVSVSNGDWSGNGMGSVCGNGNRSDMVGHGGLVDGLVSGVDVRSLNDLLDGVDLVGLGHRDGTWHGDLVGGGHVLVDDDLTWGGDWHVDGHVNVVLDHVELGNDLGDLGSDPGVGSHRGEDLLCDDGVSWGGALVGGRWGDGQERRGGGGDGGRCDGDGVDGVLGNASDVGVCGLGDALHPGHAVLVTSLNLLNTDLSHLVADHAVLNMVLDHGGPGSVAVVSLADSHGG